MVWYQLTDLINILLSYAYFGAFAISLMGSLIPFLPLPHLIPVVLLADRFDPLILGVMSGIGSALGKITSYMLGRFSRRILKAKNEKIGFMANIINKYGAIAVFLFALTPLPDDVIYIPVGFARLKFLKFMIANSIGKIILSVFVAYLGKTYFDIARLIVGGEVEIYIIIASIVAMVIISLILFKIDWEELITTYKRYGFKTTLKILIIPRKNRRR
ncbi:MAG: VTT domain-containing protein [Aigarchaeota archaeon]|nr:VTT domain-containing protein [Aigarchaeota archaeon]MDW7986249.1 VTT domain-containing protein [Nitrososphaerota archaeon]